MAFWGRPAFGLVGMATSSASVRKLSSSSCVLRKRPPAASDNLLFGFVYVGEPTEAAQVLDRCTKPAHAALHAAILTS